MWIERIDFAGFGDLSGEKVEFSSDKINLIVEPNDYGKSTIINAIWAILFGFLDEADGKPEERDAHRPRPELKLPFIASIDINAGGRRLKVIRDFSDNAVQVIDIGQVNKDVTREFRTASGADQVGQRLSGMSREMFRSICFLGQTNLEHHAVAGHKDYSSIFNSIASSATSATNAISAVEVVDKALTNFQFQGSTQPVEALLQNLEKRQAEVTETLNKLAAERKAQAGLLKRTDELDAEIQKETAAAETVQPAAPASNAPSEEYFALCLEAAELDNHLIRSQERFGKVQEASKSKPKQAVSVDKFPQEIIKSVEDLWTRRASRKTDYERLFQDVSPRIRDYEASEKNIRDKWNGADKFSVDEAQQIGVLAVTLRNVEQELEDLKKRRASEIHKVEGLDIDFSRLDQTRKQLLSLDPRDYDDARSYAALMNSFQDGISEAEKAIWRSQMIMSELEEKKKEKKGIFPLPSSGKKKEQIAAEQEIEKQNAKITDLKNKITGLEVRLDTLARKSGMSDGKQLLSHLKEYSTSAGSLKDLDMIDQMISTREGGLSRAQMDLEGFFERAGRVQLGINADTAIELAEEIKRYHEETKNMNAAFQAVNQARQQLDFLVGEINDIEDFLYQLFAQADIQDDNVENGYKEFQARLATFRRAKSGQTEPEQPEAPASGPSNQDMLMEINRLETARSSVWARMQEIVEKYPEIADQAPPGSTKQAPPPVVSEKSKKHLEELRSEREKLVSQLRSANQRYDMTYLPSREEQEQISRDLQKVRRAKAALELSRTTLKKLSGEGQADWSVRLNQLAEESLAALDVDFDRFHFDSDLQVTAGKPNDARVYSSVRPATFLSSGMQRQLHLVARLSLTQFLSQETSLPLILDEPFNDFDDERFLKFFRYLLDNFPPHNQIIILSCHRIRHQWMITQLTEAQKARFTFPKRMPLRAPKSS